MSPQAGGEVALSQESVWFSGSSLILFMFSGRRGKYEREMLSLLLPIVHNTTNDTVNLVCLFSSSPHNRRSIPLSLHCEREREMLYSSRRLLNRANLASRLAWPPRPFSTIAEVNRAHHTSRLVSPPRPFSTIAEETYQRAVACFEKSSDLAKELEEKRNRQQYDAWERTQERKNPISSGVAVVKTIARQTRVKDKVEEQQEALLEEAQSLLQEAALQHGHKTALVRLGNAALEQKDQEKAMDYYRQAGERGSPEGWFNLGHLMWEQDELSASMEAFQKAIDLGDSDAMYFVGVQYLSEEETEEQHRLGLNLIQNAAEQGHSGALYYLALFYLNGSDILGIEPCSTVEFCTRLDKACDGSPEALFMRGHGYYHGDHGFEQNYANALVDFLQAAELDHADAAVSAGAMLHQGIGGKRDQRRAFELYQEAGELGSIEGWRNVVACYALGEGVPQSKETAKYISKTMLKDDD